jgi:dihydroorotase
MAVFDDPGRIMPVAAGAYNAASPAQIEEIVRRIERGLDEGAVSIGAGFPYTPGATRDELLAVFRVAARTSTPVHTHIRPGVDGLKEALDLAHDAGASLHVVHINSAGNEQTPEMLRLIGAARQRGQDVTTEAYPYDAGMTQIESATVQDPYTHERADRVSEIEWPPTGERLNAASFKRYSQIGGPVVIHTNTEAMVSLAIGDPLTMIGSDVLAERPDTSPPAPSRACWDVRPRDARPDADGRDREDDADARAQLLSSARASDERKGRIAVGADART